MNFQYVLFCMVSVVTVQYAVAFKLIRSKRSTNVPSRCLQNPDSGMCLAYFLNYYYNPSSGECETFVYGGCQGNDNNFWTKDDCEAICKPKTNETEENQSLLLESLESLIEAKDVCEYPPETGECRALFIRYYYNGEKCSPFVYGGCDGNPNNFETEVDCMERCGPKSEDEGLPRNERSCRDMEDPCFKSPCTGHCLARMIRYYYNDTSDTCNKFLYGGCGGNDNNFETGEDCKDACGGTVVDSDDDDAPVFLEPCDDDQKEDKEDICDYPPETGPCKAGFRRYYFNGTDCVLFTYGGCKGNPNRFRTKEECLAVCCS